MEKENKNRKIFYGYIIVAVSLLILVVMHGLQGSYGIFLGQIQKETGWPRAVISGANSLAFFLMAVFAIVSGRLTDKSGPKLTMLFGGLFLGAGYFLASRMGTVWQLYLFYGLFVGIGTSTGDVSLMSTTARWFISRRGLMTSIVKSGTGLGLFLMPLVAGWLIVSYQWRTAYAILAIVAVAGIVPLAWFLKRDPLEMGLKPHDASVATSINQFTAGSDLTLHQVLRTRQFWISCAAYFIIWYTAQSVLVHIAAHAVDTGLSVAQSATIVSVLGAVSILGRLTMGVTGDKIGNRRALIICFVLALVALVWLQFASGLVTLFVFAAIYGFAHGGFFAIVSPLVAELFGMKSHGSNLGMLFFFGETGGAIGPVITGRIFDVTHSYRLAFLIISIGIAIGLLLATLLKPVKRGKQPGAA